MKTNQTKTNVAWNANVSQKSYNKDQKVDDEDGHYIVVPDADLTERCMCFSRHDMSPMKY